LVVVLAGEKTVYFLGGLGLLVTLFLFNGFYLFLVFFGLD